MWISGDSVCYFCHETMTRGEFDTSFGLDSVTYYCTKCGAVTHYATDSRQKIKHIKVNYTFEDEETREE